MLQIHIFFTIPYQDLCVCGKYDVLVSTQAKLNTVVTKINNFVTIPNIIPSKSVVSYYKSANHVSIKNICSFNPITWNAESVCFLYVFKAMDNLALHNKIDADLVLDAFFNGEYLEKRQYIFICEIISIKIRNYVIYIYLFLELGDIAAEIKFHVVSTGNAKGQFLNDHLTWIGGIYGDNKITYMKLTILSRFIMSKKII